MSAPKMHEAARNTLDLFRSMLLNLDAEQRDTVFKELGIDVGTVHQQLDEARENVEEHRRHNEQRLEEVYEARRLLGATANETLPMAVKRVLADGGG